MAATPEGLNADLLKAFQDHPELADICGAPIKAVARDGLTNRVWRMEAAHGVFFLRLPGIGAEAIVDRQAEASNLGVATRLGIALPALFIHPGEGILLTGAVDVPGRAPKDFPEQLGNALAGLHGSCAPFTGLLDPEDVYRQQRDGLHPAAEFAGEIEALDQAMNDLAGATGETGAVRHVPVHGDLSPGNCLWTRDRLWLIDWEYSAMADPAWDLAYAILEHGFSEAQESAFLKAYKNRQAPDLMPGAARIGAMKARCDAVSALWALGQVARGRDAQVFLPFARGRRDRALARVGELGGNAGLTEDDTR